MTDKGISQAATCNTGSSHVAIQPTPNTALAIIPGQIQHCLLPFLMTCHPYFSTTSYHRTQSMVQASLQWGAKYCAEDLADLPLLAGADHSMGLL